MKKLIWITLLIIIIPYIVLSIYEKEIKEIRLDYESSITVRVKRLKTGKIEEVELEAYIVGVLAGEMPIYFEMEALKAQAVASRSYVLRRIEENKDLEYDVVDSVMNQVYLDLDYLMGAWGDGYIANINKLRMAVNSTYFEYMSFGEEVVEALFFSTSNGYTESSSLVFGFDKAYLKSVESTWDMDTSSAFWSKQSFLLSDFYSKLGLSYSDYLTVDNIKRSSSNRVLSLNINGKKFIGTDVRTMLGLKSTDFTIVQDVNMVNINVKGYGHGVGMSQYGALGMANLGYKYIDILEYYYKDINIKKIN